MKTIELTQGQVALVDDADYEAVSRFNWHAKRTRKGKFYAATKDYEGVNKYKTVRLHRFLLPDAEEIDHIDGNGLNNQRSNLRSCTHAENVRAFNTKRKGASSRFRGVCLNQENGKWRAALRINKKLVHLGYFTDESDAARAYDEAAHTYFGEFASPNFP